MYKNLSSENIDDLVFGLIILTGVFAYFFFDSSFIVISLSAGIKDFISGFSKKEKIDKIRYLFAGIIIIACSCLTLSIHHYFIIPIVFAGTGKIIAGFSNFCLTTYIINRTLRID